MWSLVNLQFVGGALGGVLGAFLLPGDSGDFERQTMPHQWRVLTSEDRPLTKENKIDVTPTQALESQLAGLKEEIQSLTNAIVSLSADLNNLPNLLSRITAPGKTTQKKTSPVEKTPYKISLIDFLEIVSQVTRQTFFYQEADLMGKEIVFTENIQSKSPDELMQLFARTIRNMKLVFIEDDHGNISVERLLREHRYHPWPEITSKDIVQLTDNHKICRTTFEMSHYSAKKFAIQAQQIMNPDIERVIGFEDSNKVSVVAYLDTLKRVYSLAKKIDVPQK